MRAKKRSVSFNSELLRTLQQDVIGHGKATQRKINLDWLYGTGGTSDAEQKTFDAQRVIDLDAWAIK